MKIQYIATYWGQDVLSLENFTQKALDAGYQGIEAYVREETSFVDEICNSRYHGKIPFVAQLYLSPEKESFEEYRQRFLRILSFMSRINPVLVNSHTGKDYFSFEQNSILIQDALDFTNRTGIKIVHETHRSRFAFHVPSLLPYLDKFPDLKLNADFSHLCVVSESLLEDQKDHLDKLIERSEYIHARVGSTQAPQVNDPFAPEWIENLEVFTDWWIQIAAINEIKGAKSLYICPEFGPSPYMPALPYSQVPLSDQWELNLRMMRYLKTRIPSDPKI